MKPWIEFHVPRPAARLRLFCYPYAGGAAQLFRKWQDLLPATVEVCPIQPPGRWSRLREPLITRIPRLLDVMIPALRPLMDMPFALFGHSLGALTMFELARELRKRVQPSPLRLLVSARCAPQLPHRYPPIYSLPEPEFLQRILRYGGIPNEVLQDADLMQIMMPIMRADMEMFDTYAHSPGPPLACPIAAFGGLQDRTTDREEIDAWRAQTTGGFSLAMFTGGHFFLHSAEQLLLQRLSRELDSALATT